MVNYILSKSPNGLFLIFERSVQFDFTIRHLNLNGNRTGTILNNITNTASYNDNENTNINGTFNNNNTSTIFSCLILWHQA